MQPAQDDRLKRMRQSPEERGKRTLEGEPGFDVRPKTFPGNLKKQAGLLEVQDLMWWTGEGPDVVVDRSLKGHRCAGGKWMIG
jgi:hypothetical protein